jgi:hypothetical protein
VAAKKSPRTLRREAERANAKLVRARERLALLEPGGTPVTPIAVASASVVEASARSHPCAQCGGALRIDEHAAIDNDGDRLRVVRAKCLQCGAPRVLYFRIVQPN